jgi:hypothetical protein
MAVRAPQVPTQSVNEERFHAISFSGKLDVGELLTGTPTITEIDTALLTITSKAVNTVALTVNGLTVPIGEAVQCKVVGAGMTPGVRYRILVVCSTDAGQIVDGEIRFTAA